MITYPGAELVLAKLKLLEKLLKTKLTEEQTAVVDRWCKTDERILSCEK